MRTTLVAEIGSTTTIVNAFTGLDGDNPRFAGQGFAPTTVEHRDGVLKGLDMALGQLWNSLGQELQFDEVYATSSAAGGLKMTVHGLMYDMTVKAAKEAALGAGAVLKYATAGELSQHDLERILQIKPNIILLAGGVDYGDKAVILKNASFLAAALPRAGLNPPVIFAGNAAAAEEGADILQRAGLKVYTVENVYPAIDQLNVEPARRVIQAVFEEHITQAPGMQRIRERVSGAILPTPGAVMQAAITLYEEMGDVLVIDVGGATTDVHSVSAGNMEKGRNLLAPEPLAKRTVEGDLGVYVNAPHLFTLIGVDKLKERYGEDFEKLLKPVPETVEEITFSRELTNTAVQTAVRRHAGKLVHIFGPSGRTTMVQGKDLTQIKTIIGTGGALTRLPGGTEILNSLRVKGQNELLPQPLASVLLDNNYIFASLGVLAHQHRQGAMYLMLESMGIER